MRIVVIIFAVLGLLLATGLSSITFVRANDDAKDLNEVYAKLDELKANAEKDASAKMLYDMSKEEIEKGLNGLTPGKFSAIGYVNLFISLVAFLALIFMFTKKDSITLYLGAAGILLAVATYFMAPVIPQSEFSSKATYPQLALILIGFSLVGFGLAILAGKMRKPAAA